MQNAQDCRGGLLGNPSKYYFDGTHGPPRPLLPHAAVFSSKNALWGSVWLVSHHQPLGAAAYNRDAYVGQQQAFVKGRPVAQLPGGGGGGATGGGGAATGEGPASAEGR